MSTRQPDASRGVPFLQSLQRFFGRSAPAPRAPTDDPVLARLEAIQRQLDAPAAPAGPPAPPETALADHLAAIERRLAALTDAGGAADATHAALAALEKQIGRAGREQLKANTLAEAQREQVQAALEALQTAAGRRDEEVAALRDGASAAATAARLEVVRALLPALDGLDEAIRSGRHLQDLQPAAPPRPRTVFERMRAAQSLPLPVEPGLRQSLGAWLVGLTFVRARLLDVLAAEGVRPMRTVGEPFDSTRHVALEVVPASPTLAPGTVAAELRTGYLTGDRVLRYAEVAVAKETEPESS